MIVAKNIDENDRFLRHLVSSANYHFNRLKSLADEDRRYDYMASLIGEAQLAFAVWQDPKKPHGIDFVPIKGLRHLRKVFGNPFPHEFTIVGVPVQNEEVARVAVVQFADPKDRLH